MAFLYLKSLHIIFVITWFAGLFYIVRLFIYHCETLEDKEKSDHDKKILIDQFQIMERRLWYGITWPSCILATIFGLSLLHVFFPLSENQWLIAKLLLVCLLFFYHLSCGKIYKDLKNNIKKYSGQQLRFWNEVATVFLVSIVFLVELQEIASLTYSIIGLILFSLFILLGIQVYKKIRS